MIKAAEASAQGLSQPWIELEIQQLEAGCYQGAVTFLDAGNMQLVHERQNRLVHKAGVMPDNTCTLSLAFGRAPALRFSEFRDPKPLFLLPANTEIDILVSGKTETLYICLEQDRLVSTLRQLNPRLWERPARVLRAFQTPDTCQMARELAHLLRPSNPSAASPRSRLSPRDQPLLIDFLARILNTSAEVRARDTADCRAGRSAGQYVKRARDFIDACLQAENLPTIADICAHLGISERTLQYAFRDQLQLTPVAYLRIYRLNQVRRALLRVESADTTVTSVATHWGFWHLGKFAQDYRRQFGERPSDSLASGRVAGFLARNCLSAEM
jgi:AraC family ethanolamine operon transcriptional activator